MLTLYIMMHGPTNVTCAYLLLVQWKSLFLDLSLVYDAKHLDVIPNPSARRRNWFYVTRINLIRRLLCLVLASRGHVVS
jgi:hypothetical protein